MKQLAKVNKITSRFVFFLLFLPSFFCSHERSQLKSEGLESYLLTTFHPLAVSRFCDRVHYGQLISM